MRPRAVTLLAPLVVAATALAACGGDDDAAGDTVTTASAGSVVATTADGAGAGGDVAEVVAGEPFPAERCAANRAAGTIAYNSGFDYAAAASIIEVLVAEAAGYYDEMCLDVEFTPSFSVANYPLVAANDVQFASSGSFSELASYAAANDADLVAVTVDGRVSIDSLILKPGTAETLEDLEGVTLGMKGAIPPSVQAMLAQAGLLEGTGYQTVLLDGFDPTAHIAVPDIAGFPGWKSNEPGALERAGIEFDLFDPADYDIPGSFGLIYTNREFLEAHPTAAEDFVRATLKGLNDAIADPTTAATAAFDLVEENGNPNFLTIEGESFRWSTDAALITDSAQGNPNGVPVPDDLVAEIAAYDTAGVYPDGAPATDGRWSELAAGLYDESGTVIWPSV